MQESVVDVETLELLTATEVDVLGYLTSKVTGREEANVLNSGEKRSYH
jgi:hypothetical protein